MVALRTNSFIDAITTEGIVVVDFSAEREACRAFARKLDDAAKRHGDVTFAMVDTDENPELTAALDVQAIPTVMVFRESILVFRRAGALPDEALDDVLEQVRSLDMVNVRREVHSAREA